MTDTNDTLRALIRLIPPARALRESLEKSLHLELYEGTGDFAVQSFQGLQAGVAAVTADPVGASLAIHPPATATDREKVSLALLAAGQLAAYLEGQTGLAGLGGGGSQIQTAPNISGITITGGSPASSDKMVDTIARAVGAQDEPVAPVS